MGIWIREKKIIPPLCRLGFSFEDCLVIGRYNDKAFLGYAFSIFSREKTSEIWIQADKNRKRCFFFRISYGSHQTSICIE